MEKNLEANTKYFNADKARSVAHAVINKLIDEELDYIYEEINKAMFNGLYSITFHDKYISYAAEEFLKSKGFKIEHFCGVQWDPANDTTISW